VKRSSREYQEMDSQNHEIPPVADGCGDQERDRKQVGIEVLQDDEGPRLRRDDHRRHVPAASTADGVERVKQKKRRRPCAANLPEHQRERAELQWKNDECADDPSSARMPEHKRPNARRAIVFDVPQLMPDNAA